ncbi:RTA1-domain-containing protein [Schizophyllum commune H4-8]|nr:RTA1-domain-containing protein [Schizophyllum commune H4-8]KAI5888722.1 RTA1-domain-containing protein [Schizophyllum commune H4-8]
MSAMSDLAPDQIKDLSPYGYVPTEWASIFFLVLFGVTTFAHLGQAIVYRGWWLFVTLVFCGSMECVGWACRLWSNRDILADNAYKIQCVYVMLIVAPTPLLAANFVMMGRIVRRLGIRYSRLSPRSYTIVFASTDVISLLVQGGGGGVAVGADTLEGAERGGNIVLGGICLQLAVIVFFSIIASEFFWRYFKDRPRPKLAFIHPEPRGVLTRNLILAVGCLGSSTLLLLIRAVYRVIELADGWNGTIIKTEAWFLIFDAAMVVIAMFIVNVLHPGWLLDESDLISQREAHELKGAT